MSDLNYLSVYSVNVLPDFTLNKYQSIADTGVEGVLNRHMNFLREWHGICKTANVSLHLLYLYRPDEPIGKKLQNYLFLRGNKEKIKLIEPLLVTTALSDFFPLEKSTIPSVKFESAATLLKKERIAEIYNPYSNETKSYHYVPEWVPNDSGRLLNLLNMMKTISESYEKQSPCGFRVDLYPVSMEEDTRDKFRPLLKRLHGDNNISLVNDSNGTKIDDFAKDVAKNYENWMEAIETTPHFRMNLYAFADDRFKTKILLNAAGAEAVSEGDFSIAPIKSQNPDGSFSALSRIDNGIQNYCYYQKHAVMPEWATTWLLEEVAPFFRFPCLYDGESLDLPKETAPIQITDGIYLGKDQNGFPVNFSIKDLPRHAFFTGMPGSGKTNTMLHIVSELLKKDIPFLALEPAKKEYRALLAKAGNEHIHLFSPHLMSRFPLQVNPMQFPKGMMLNEHITALMEVFRGTFLLEGPTQKFLDTAIQKSYFDLGWSLEDINTDDLGLEFPTLQNVYNNLENEINQSTYDAEFKGNVQGFLQNRLGGLMQRDAGELFNTCNSTLEPGDWLHESAIVELEVLGEQEKNFFVLLVTHYIFESLRANPSGGRDDMNQLLPVRHVIFIEEAHNIIASSSQQDNSDSVNPKVSSTAYIVKMLAEVRALREAIVIADQLPTALTSEVTKNTGLKLVHRLTSQDDRELIGTAVSATPVQLERMASFTTGKALIYHERTKKPFEVQIAEWIKPKTGFDPSVDEELFNYLYKTRNIQQQIVSALKNWRYKVLVPIENELELLENNMLKAATSLEKTSCRIDLKILQSDFNKSEKKFNRLINLWLQNDEENSELMNEFVEINYWLELAKIKLEAAESFMQDREANL